MPDTSSQAAYRAFCATAPDVPLFAQPWYLDACVEGGSWDAVLALKKGRPVAALPYFVKQKGPFRYATMPPFVKWLGPYLLPELRGQLATEHTVLKDLIAQLPPLAAFKQNFYPTITNWLPFYWAGYQQTTYYTYRLTDLDNLPALEARLEADMRRTIRKTAKFLRVVHDLNPRILFDFVPAIYQKQQLPMPFSWGQFKRLDDILAAQQARKLFFAVDADGRVHGAAQLIWDAQTAYFHLTADDPTLPQSGAGKFLIWETIRYAAEVLKLRCFDFEGSILPGVEYVRVRFGATQVPYFFVWKNNSRAFALLEGAKSIFRHTN